MIDFLQWLLRALRSRSDRFRVVLDESTRRIHVETVSGWATIPLKSDNSKWFNDNNNSIYHMLVIQ